MRSKDFLAEVFDVKNIDDRVLHFVRLVEGSIKNKSKATLIVNREDRIAIARNHTATHLLQAALREVLGSHVEQAGSYVDSRKLRFDFNHFKALSFSEIEEVEDRVNEYILANLKVNIKMLSYKQAKKEGAIALFSEKYGDQVRVVDILEVSKELCGGTHVNYTGDIGLFKLVSDTSSAAGVRRIEAMTAKEARACYRKEERILSQILSLFSTTQSKVVEDLNSLAKRVRLSKEQDKNTEKSNIDSEASRLISQAEDLKGSTFIVSELDKDMDYISQLSDKIKIKSKNNTIIMLYSFIDRKVKLVLGATKDLIDKGFDARVMLDKISTVIDGGGGGRAEFIKAGGKDISRLKEAAGLIREYIGDNL